MQIEKFLADTRHYFRQPLELVRSDDRRQGGEHRRAGVVDLVRVLRGEAGVERRLPAASRRVGRL